MVSDVRLYFIKLSKGVRDAVVAEVGVLDGAWVAVMVDESPGALVGLEDLVRQVGEDDFLRGDDELVSLVADLWGGSEEGEDWDTTDSPLAWFIGELFDTDGKSCEFSVEKGCGSESESGTKAAIEIRRMSSSSLITKEMGNWSE